MKRLVAALNSSRTLGRLISFFSGALARNRGVPILAGVVLVVISLVVHVLAAITDDVGWRIIAFLVLHAAIFTGLLGVLLAEPLGRG